MAGIPAFRNRALNPYNALLYQTVASAGAVVEEFRLRSLVGRRYDVVHIHWPEYLFSAPGVVRAVVQSLIFTVILGILRRRRTSIVWTVHNLPGHRVRHPRLEARMWRWFVGRVDGYIALSPAGRAAVLAQWPDLARRPGFVIPHGHYRPVYPNGVDRATARRLLQLPPAARVVCFFGAIRPYKNVPALVAAFRDVPGAAWRLLVVGRAWTHELATELERQARPDPRISLTLDFVPDEKVQVYLRAADLVVLPYTEILNSGSAILALSFGVPVLVPAAGAMADLAKLVGPDWVRTYEGEVSAATLVSAMRWALTGDRRQPPDLSELEWDRIGKQTLAAFGVVCGEKPVPVGLTRAH